MATRAGWVGKDLGAGGHVAVVMPADRREECREERFNALYLRHYGAIYAYVHRRLVGLRAEVTDVVADVFSVAWRRLDEVPDPPEDRLWLYGVARRCVGRARRSGWRRRRLQAKLSDETRATTNGRSEDAPVSLVRDAMERLRPSTAKCCSSLCGMGSRTRSARLCSAARPTLSLSGCTRRGSAYRQSWRVAMRARVTAASNSKREPSDDRS